MHGHQGGGEPLGWRSSGEVRGHGAAPAGPLLAEGPSFAFSEVVDAAVGRAGPRSRLPSEWPVDCRQRTDVRGARVGVGVRKQGGDWDGPWAWSG